MIDSHTHLTSKEFKQDRFDVLMSAREAGISRMLAVGTNLNDSQMSMELARKFSFIDASIGLHPHEASQWNTECLDYIKTCLSSAVAIGEIGLDFYYNFSTPDQQIHALTDQLELAQAEKMPVILHCRDAYSQLISILDDTLSNNHAGGVIHCFNGSLEHARQFLNMGFLVGFGGMLTFKKSDNLRSVFQAIPNDSILFETDCPYLAPVPYRGKRNEPKYVSGIYTLGAHLKQTPLETLTGIIANNYARVFNLNDSISSGSYIYRNGNRCYINLTNDCMNKCHYCIRAKKDSLWGYNLWLDKEPAVADVVSAISQESDIQEFIFCGYGEPLLRYKKIVSIAKCLLNTGIPIRINTSGHLPRSWNIQEIIDQLSPLINTIEVSIGGASSESYIQICRPVDDQPETAFDRVIEFVKTCIAAQQMTVKLSVVTDPDIDLNACRNLAAELGLPLKERPYSE